MSALLAVCIDCPPPIRPSAARKIHPKSLKTHKTQPRCGEHWRAWDRAQKAKRSAYGRKKNYGLEQDERAECIEAQGGVCPLCLRQLDSVHRKAMSPTDHDHGCCPKPPTCGQCTRGITCGWCNKNLLGSLHMSPGEELAVARRVVAYLEDPPMQRVRRRRAVSDVESA
jgi:hypothetical protein